MHPCIVELSREAATFLLGVVKHMNQVKVLPAGDSARALETSAWLEEIEAATARVLAKPAHNPSNPDHAGDWYANQSPDNSRTMLEIAAAQLRYALESDEPSAAMRTTLTTAQNALNNVCRNCAGERWEDAEDGGRCINCGTPHHESDVFGDLPPGKPCPTVPVATLKGQPCARTTGWCDGVMCRETERDCPNAEPM